MEKPASGEFELIARLTQGLSSRPDVNVGVGDDCAILDIGGNMLLLATCDSQVEGVHFTLQTSTPEQIGRKALAINLSDIAAMGGEPRYALISLILPGRDKSGPYTLDVLDGIYAGLRQEAEQFATAIVGGNIAGAGKSDQFILDITLLGVVKRGHALMRNGAKAGDTIFVTGSPGDSAAGLYTLLHPEHAYPQEACDRLRTIHRVPQPRVPEGRILSRLGPEKVTSMIDISDGLSGDLGHICERSSVGARIEAARLPLSAALLAIATAASITRAGGGEARAGDGEEARAGASPAPTIHEPFSWALHGGEDYELLFTVSPGNEDVVIKAVQAETGTPLSAIGTITPPEEGMKVVWPDGREEDLVARSWDHLRHV